MWFQENVVVFALWHASLGCLIAGVVAAVLRRHSAGVRCWVWRLGLLKGPLAFVLAVPVAILAPVPMVREEVVPVVAYDAPSVVALAPVPAEQPNLWPLLYGAGVCGVLIVRYAAARRVDRRMPRVEGVFQPRVRVPDDLEPDQAAMAVAHETAHLRRRDPQWSFVAELLCAAFWFAPPVWICARMMRAEAEAACDADALAQTGANRAAYADLLLSFAGPAPSTALSGPARRLARRILMLDKTARSLPRFTVAALAATGLFVMVPWRAEAQSRPTAPKPAVARKNLSRIKAEEAVVMARLQKMRVELAQLQAETTSLRKQKELLRLQEGQRRVSAEQMAMQQRIVQKELAEARRRMAEDQAAAANDRALEQLRRKAASKEMLKAQEARTKALVQQIKAKAKQQQDMERQKAGQEIKLRATGVSGRVEGPNADGEREDVLTAKDLTIAGQSVNAMAAPAHPGDPIKVWTEGNKTYRVYRTGSKAPYTYRVSVKLTKGVQKGG